MWSHWGGLKGNHLIGAIWGGGGAVWCVNPLGESSAGCRCLERSRGGCVAPFGPAGLLAERCNKVRHPGVLWSAVAVAVEAGRGGRGGARRRREAGISGAARSTWGGRCPPSPTGCSSPGTKAAALAAAQS